MNIYISELYVRSNRAAISSTQSDASGMSHPGGFVFSFTMDEINYSILGRKIQQSLHDPLYGKNLPINTYKKNGQILYEAFGNSALKDFMKGIRMSAMTKIGDRCEIISWENTGEGFSEIISTRKVLSFKSMSDEDVAHHFIKSIERAR